MNTSSIESAISVFATQIKRDAKVRPTYPQLTDLQGCMHVYWASKIENPRTGEWCGCMLERGRKREEGGREGGGEGGREGGGEGGRKREEEGGRGIGGREGGRRKGGRDRGKALDFKRSLLCSCRLKSCHSSRPIHGRIQCSQIWTN